MRPNIEMFSDVVRHNQSFFDKYDCYVYGGFLQTTDTWDIDLLVVSEINSEVGGDCVDLCNSAHQLKQLLDISVVTPETFRLFMIQTEIFNTTGVFKRFNEIESGVYEGFYKPHDKIYKNGIDVSDKVTYTKIENNLWEIVPIPEYEKKLKTLPEKVRNRKKIATPISVKVLLQRKNKWTNIKP